MGNLLSCNNKMASVKMLNPNADHARKGTAINVNIMAAKGMMNILKTNLGPRGTVKMLVSGAGDIRLTKDGSVLLHQMQLQHPTAALIARTATAQDDATGDGTTTCVLMIGELLRQADRFLQEGLHPRVITQGFEIAKNLALEELEKMKLDVEIDRELLMSIARTSLYTKLTPKIAEQLTGIVVDAVMTIHREGKQIDLFMVEIMSMLHKTAAHTKLIRGLVLDHGARHPGMAKYQENCHILICNVSLEYEKTELNSGFFYASPEEREKMVQAERRFVQERVEKIIAFKESVVTEDKPGFVVINQKGIDAQALDLLYRAGIVALRRAKRRNMERLSLACGGYAVNSVDDLDADCLGYAGKVYETVLGEDKFTFVEEVSNPFSCSILIKGPNSHTVSQIKDAIRDGLRAVKNAIEDQTALPGGGAVEMALSTKLLEYKKTVKGKVRLGVEAFATALQIVPKTLAANSGFDQTEMIVKLEDAFAENRVCGVDVMTGEVMDPVVEGVLDNYRVKKMLCTSATVIATNVLLVDEMLRAGKNLGKKSSNPGDPVR